jgi:hypothetical protein
MVLNQSVGSAHRVTAWSLAAEVATEPHFLWILLTAWLLRCVLQPAPSLPRLIRLGSLRRAAIAASGDSARTLVTSLLFAIVIWLAAWLALQLPSSGKNPAGSAAQRFETMAGSVPLGVGLQLVLVALTFLMIDLAITTLRFAHPSPVPVLCLAIALWGSAAWATTGLAPASAINAGFYLNASLGAQYPSTGVAAVGVLLACLALCGLVILRLDRRTRGRAAFRIDERAWFALTVVGILGLAMKDQTRSSLVDGISSVFAGSGSIRQFATSTVIFVGYAWLFGVGLSRSSDRWLELTWLRYGSRLRWGLSLGARELAKAVGFVAGLLVTASVLYVLEGGRGFNPPDVGTAAWSFQFLVNGVLQLLVYLLVVFGATFLTRGRNSAVIAVGLLVALCYAQSTPMSWLPVQLSGMRIALTGWHAILGATVTLLVALALAAGTLPLLFRWKTTRS